MKRMSRILVGVAACCIAVVAKANATPAEALYVTEPMKCDNLSSNVATTCKHAVVKGGRFEYYNIYKAPECKYLKDSSLTWQCIESVSNGKPFSVQELDKQFVQANKDIEFSASSSEAIARSSETIAHCMIIQTIVLVAGATVGLFVLLSN